MKIFFTSILVGVAALGIWSLSVSCSPSSPPAASAATGADLKTADFHVEGMDCGGCEVGIRMALKKLKGVESVDASYEKGTARVTYEPAKINPEIIKVEIEKLGYQADLQTGG